MGFYYLANYFLFCAAAMVRWDTDTRRQLMLFSAVALILIVGLRNEVGGDWNSYLIWVERARGTVFWKGLVTSDLAYAALNWVGANVIGGIYFVNLACAAIAVICLSIFCSRMPLPILAMALAVPYLVTVVFMGYTRQSVAIGLSLLAILAAVDQRFLRFILIVLAAGLFHKTAFFVLIFAPACVSLRLTPVFIAGCLVVAATSFLVAMIFMHASFFALYESYILGSGNYYSSGAVGRLGLGLVAAGALILLWWKGALSHSEKKVWGTAALASTALFVGAFFFSTVADRLGLYLVALQFFALSALPTLFRPSENFAVRIALLSLYGVSLWVWLNFGTHSEALVPYGNILENYL